ncbi:MAG: flagellin [Clostridium sp.]|nr:flagellin [Clostridium sp.]
MRLCHNMNSLKAYNAYSKNLSASKAASKKVSTGLKINSAKDNPSKIGQLNELDIKLKSMQSAERNVQDSASMLQVSDGALQEVSNILSRMKELAVSANDGSKSDSDIQIIQDEIDQLKNNLNDISRDTEFNGVKLLGADGISAPNEKYVVVGSEAGNRDKLNFYNTSTNNIGFKKADGTFLSVDDIDFVNDKQNAGNFINVVDGAIDNINKIRSEIGAKSNIYNDMVDISQENQMLITSSISRIGDADMAEQALEISRTDILINAGLGLISQCNQLPLNCLQIIQGSRR